MTTPSLFDAVPDSVSDDPRFTAQTETAPKKTRTSKKSQDGDRMAKLFRSKPNELVSALLLEDLYGLRWRTTVSDLRFPPYDMDVRNEQVPYVTFDGKHKRKSFYRYVVPNEGA